MIVCVRIRKVTIRDRYEVRNAKTGIVYGRFEDVETAKTEINAMVNANIKHCTGSSYIIVDRMTGEVVYGVESDNTDRFTIDDMKSKIIAILKEELSEMEEPEFEGLPNPEAMLDMARLSEILVRKIHPEWF